MRTAKSLTLAKVLSCALIASLILGFLLPLVAVDIPSYGDGAEMVMAAFTGSLVHPPGFPVFSHFNEWMYHIVGGAPYETVASFSVFEHAIAATILFWVLSYWLESLVLAAGLTLCFALAPETIKIATDAEVFAFHHLMMAVLIWVALSVYRKPTLYKVMGFGFVFGVAGAHHPLAIFWVPLVFLPLIKNRNEIFKQSFAFLLFGFIGLCPYFLLFERFDAAPGWAFGHVTTFSELYHHAMRTTYGTLKLSGQFSGDVTSLLGPFLLDTLKTAPVLLVLFGYGLLKSYKEKNASRLILCFVFMLHILFLLLGHPLFILLLKLGVG